MNHQKKRVQEQLVDLKNKKSKITNLESDKNLIEENIEKTKVRGKKSGERQQQVKVAEAVTLCRLCWSFRPQEALGGDSLGRRGAGRRVLHFAKAS